MGWQFWLACALGLGALIIIGYLIGSFRQKDKTDLAETTAKKQSEIAHGYKRTAEILTLPAGSKRDIVDRL